MVSIHGKCPKPTEYRERGGVQKLICSTVAPIRSAIETHTLLDITSTVVEHLALRQMWPPHIVGNLRINYYKQCTHQWDLTTAFQVRVQALAQVRVPVRP